MISQYLATFSDTQIRVILSSSRADANSPCTSVNCGKCDKPSNQRGHHIKSTANCISLNYIRTLRKICTESIDLTGIPGNYRYNNNRLPWQITRTRKKTYGISIRIGVKMQGHDNLPFLESRSNESFSRFGIRVMFCAPEPKISGTREMWGSSTESYAVFNIWRNWSYWNSFGERTLTGKPATIKSFTNGAKSHQYGAKYGRIAISWHSRWANLRYPMSRMWSLDQVFIGGDMFDHRRPGPWKNVQM